MIGYFPSPTHGAKYVCLVCKYFHDYFRTESRFFRPSNGLLDPISLLVMLVRFNMLLHFTYIFKSPNSPCLNLSAPKLLLNFSRFKKPDTTPFTNTFFRLPIRIVRTFVYGLNANRLLWEGEGIRVSIQVTAVINITRFRFQTLPWFSRGGNDIFVCILIKYMRYRGV